MKIQSYLFHAFIERLRHAGPRGRRLLVLYAMSGAAVTGALYEAIMTLGFTGHLPWLHHIGTVLLTTLAAGATVAFALAVYDRMERQFESSAAESERLGRELVEERNLLRALMSGTPDLIYFKDHASRFLRVNEAMARRFGWASPLDSVGLTDFDLFPEELAKLKFADERRVMDTGEPMIGREERDRTPDGRTRWLSSSKMPLRDRQGRIVGTFGISRDITARIEAETRQESIGRGLRKVLELTDELMGCRDEDSLFRMAVELGRSQLGLERCAIFIDAGDAVRGTFGTNMRGEVTDERAHRFPFSPMWKERFRVRSTTGIRWQVSDETLHDWDGRIMQEIGRGAVAVTPIQSTKLDVVGVFCNDSAITGTPPDPVRQDVVAVYCTLLGNIVARLRADRNRLAVEERQRSLMERTDRINTLGLLAAGMAHEINNPLQGMVSHVRALQPFIPTDSSGRRSLDMVQKAIESISSLVRRLLALGSADEAGSHGADLQECIDFVAQLLESQLQRAGIKLEREPLSRPVVISMPRAEFVQILMNLLINARDAMPGGGKVRLTVAVQGTYAVLTVSDTGQGMPADVLRDIFTPFFTTKGARGSGLGLSITDSLVRTAGGRIEVSSEVGRGTVFTTYLPLRGGEAT